MHIYYDTQADAAAQMLHDGHRYAWTDKGMYRLTNGKQHVRAGLKPRMLRVSHTLNGVAYIELGKAGDAIACVDNLPFAVVVHHREDALA